MARVSKKRRAVAVATTVPVLAALTYLGVDGATGAFSSSLLAPSSASSAKWWDTSCSAGVTSMLLGDPTIIVEPTVDPLLTDAATPDPTATATPDPTATATPEPTATESVLAAATSVVLTADPLPADAATPDPTATATPDPTATATPDPTATATPEPTGVVAADTPVDPVLSVQDMTGPAKPWSAPCPVATPITVSNVTTSSANLSWVQNMAEDSVVDGYQLSLPGGASGTPVVTKDATNTYAISGTASVTGLSSNTQYSIPVYAQNHWNNYDSEGNLLTNQLGESTATFANVTTLPSAPTNLAFSAAGSNVGITWTAPSGTATLTAYKIEQSADGSTWSTTSDLDGNATDASAQVVGTAGPYFRVSAINAGGTGAASATGQSQEPSLWNGLMGTAPIIPDSTFVRTSSTGSGPSSISGYVLSGYYFTTLNFTSVAEVNAFKAAYTNYGMNDIIAVTSSDAGTGGGSWMTAGKTYYFEIHSGGTNSSGATNVIIYLTGRVYYDGSWHTLPSSGANILNGVGSSRFSLALYRNSIGNIFSEVSGGYAYNPNYLGGSGGVNYPFSASAFSAWDSTAQSTWSASHPVLMTTLNNRQASAYVTLAAAQYWKANDPYAGTIVRTTLGGYKTQVGWPADNYTAHYLSGDPWVTTVSALPIP